MEPSTEVPHARPDVIASFLIPLYLLDLPTLDDSPEIQREKDRQNAAWLKRWLPTYIVRWAVIFVATWLTTFVSTEVGLPSLVEAI